MKNRKSSTISLVYVEEQANPVLVNYPVQKKAATFVQYT